MTDAEVAVPSDRPEYSTEQVEDAKIFFTDLARWSDKVLPGAEYIRTILSALAKAGDARDEWQRTANAFAADVVGYVEEIAALRSRLESAERELKAARTPDIFGIDDMVVMGDDLGSFDLGPGDIDKVWANRYLGDRYVACRMGEDDEYEHEMFDTEAEAEAWAHSPTPTQGGTNGT
jgi:hypothetical protein